MSMVRERSILFWFRYFFYFLNNFESMAGIYTALRSGTMTEFPAHVFNNSSSFLAPGSAGCSCDLTLLTCRLIGSYRFCIVPLLAAFCGKHRKLWRCKWEITLPLKCLLLDCFSVLQMAHDGIFVGVNLPLQLDRVCYCLIMSCVLITTVHLYC